MFIDLKDKSFSEKQLKSIVSNLLKNQTEPIFKSSKKKEKLQSY